MEQKTNAFRDAVGEIVRRSRIDPEFRALALKDAAAAMKQVTSTAPPNVTLKFVDNAGPVKTFGLPAPIPEIEQLSDIELEQVAGGDVGVSWRR